MEIKVRSEIGKLKKVLVHRPGKEVERLYPELFERLLFDDIMHLEEAQKEHDIFVSKLQEEGVEVFYIEKLVADVLDSDFNLREKFITRFLEEANIKNHSVFNATNEFLRNIKDNFELVKQTIAGITKREINVHFDNKFVDLVEQDEKYPIYVDPIPNILFQRDPMASIFDSAFINNMWAVTRKREAIYTQFVYDYHPLFKNINRLSDEKFDSGTTEGGDILVINKETLFVGLSQRTDSIGIQKLANKMFERFPEFKTLVAIKIPNSHATMHLDTVLTQMDYDKFSIDAEMESLKYDYFEITREGTTKINGKIIDILRKYVSENVKTFVVGNGSPIRAKREQWNDGANCLTIEPGKIVVYNRNKITNELLKQNGIKLIEIPSSELSRGRGGPRCMSMPLEREEI